MSTTGEKLAQLRKQQGYTQARLAERAGISTSAIAMYETNRRQPDEDTIRVLADALGVPTDALREDETSASESTEMAPAKSSRGVKGEPTEQTEHEEEPVRDHHRLATSEEGANLTNLSLTRDEARVILFMRMHPDVVPFLQNFMGSDSGKRKQLEKAWRLIQAFQS